LWSFVDLNGDGLLTWNEAVSLLPLLQGLDLLGMIDLNGNGVIEYAEVSEYISADTFALVDLNGDGVIDCYDLGTPPPPPGEGEGEGEAPCPIPLDPIVWRYIFWLMLDLNEDGVVSLEEMQVYDPDIETWHWTALDLNGDGVLDWDEVHNLVTALMALDPLAGIDLNGNGVIEYEEVSSYMTPEIFARIDVNGDGVIDCHDLGTLPPPPPPPSEGEGEGEHEEPGLPPYRHVLQLLRDLFPLLDVDGDGGISLEELTQALPVDIPELPRIFAALDLNGDGVITLDEIEAALLADDFSGGPGPRPELVMHQDVIGNGFYVPGGRVLVRVVLRAPRSLPVAALGVVQTLPEGWTVGEVLETGGAVSAPAPGAAGRVEFAWLDMPTFPAVVVYAMIAPADAQGVYVLTGQALYRVADGPEQETPLLATPLAEGYGPAWCHTMDTDRDWVISLPEILRVIQLYNSPGFHCAEGTEDGYAPGPGGSECAPHNSDYLLQNWGIDLSELLRAVQMYNAPGRAYRVQEGSEDGFAPGGVDLYEVLGR
ncbi:MAG TPA: hypothetical protein PKL84_05805, partial [Candidatus Hydrogenedentes bacterium]|nr:hypothetical protein [Candidatus Hydrogenedentota bacterium]